MNRPNVVSLYIALALLGVICLVALWSGVHGWGNAASDLDRIVASLDLAYAGCGFLAIGGVLRRALWALAATVCWAATCVATTVVGAAGYAPTARWSVGAASGIGSAVVAGVLVWVIVRWLRLPPPTPPS